MRFQATALVLLTSIFFSSGCGIHLHDEGRLKDAQAAVALSEAIQSGAGTPFTAMETNLDTAHSANDEINTHLRQLTAATFETALPDSTQETLKTKITTLLQRHEMARRLIESLATQAAKDVDAALERNHFLDAPQSRGHEFSDVLDTVESRIKTLQEVLGAFGKASDVLQRVTTAFRLDPDERAAIQQILNAGEGSAEMDHPLVKAAAAANEVLNSVKSIQNNQQVKEAKELKIRAGAEVAAAEARALGEMRRHLKSIQDIKQNFDTRESMTLDTLLNPNIEVLDPSRISPAIYNAMNAEHRANLDQLAADWANHATVTQVIGQRLHRYLEATKAEAAAEAEVAKAQDRLNAAASPQDKASADEALKVANKNLNDAKRKVTNARSYTEAVIKMTTAIALLVEVEIPKDTRDMLDSALEMHRYSIRLSAINADERLNLVHQIAQGIQIYHEGGIKPDEVAHLVLEAAQVGALFDIAGKR